MNDINNHKLRDDLREQTQDAHKRVETAAAMRLLMSPELTDNQYFGILQAWLSWSYNNEAYIFGLLADCAPADLAKRSKIPLLETDLLQWDRPLAVNIQAIPTLNLQNKYQALGALYVIEGSTLGSQIIVKRLHRRFAARFLHHFYSGYGEQTEQLWLNFTAHLGACQMDSEQRKQAVIGANKTFDSIFVSLDDDVSANS